MLDDVAEHYGIDISKRASPKAKLKYLVKKLAEKNLVVILIDEYDKPLLDHIHDHKRADGQRSVLKNFYDGFKGLDAYLRAIFIMGVSKFARTSIFSGLNNLIELSSDPEAAQLLGYTESEVTSYFADYFNLIAHEHGITTNELLEKVPYWYNQYQFSQAPIKVYNPYSIVHFCKLRKFDNYWFASGTPSFLVELLKQHPNELKDIEKRGFTSATLGTFRIDKIPLVALFYQTGYLTIKEYDSQFNAYKLGYPN